MTFDHYKAKQYESLIPQIKAMIDYEDDVIAIMANTAAALKTTFGFWWVGFYIVKSQLKERENYSELVLGPFQGPVACTRIGYGKGVCGTAWERRETIIVDDVKLFPGHIACSTESKSEIVVPIISQTDNTVKGVLDIDSTSLKQFDAIDAMYLEQIVRLFP